MPDVTPSQSAQAEADPVAAISALLDAEKVLPDPQKPDGNAQPEGDDGYQPSNNAQAEGDDAEAQAEAEEKPAVAEIPLDQVEAIELEVEVMGDSGKVVEKLPIKELKLGYMRQKDYQRKTAEVARQREEVGAQVRQGIESERSKYAETLQHLHDTILETAAPELRNVDWNSLATNDPFEYVKLRNRADQINGALNAVKQKQQEVSAKLEAERLQAAKTQAQKTWAALEGEIPGWDKSLYENVLKAGEAIGFTPAESGQWLDARAIKLLHKAYLYDQLKAGTPPAEKKVAVAPKAIKPGATTSVPKGAQQRGKALENLRKTGKVEDLARYLS